MVVLSGRGPIISLRYSINCADTICDIIIHSLHSPCNFSDHAPLAFALKLDVGPCNVASISSQNCHRQHIPAIDWSLLTVSQWCWEVDYKLTIAHSLPSLSQDLLNYRSPSCVSHNKDIDTFCTQFLACLSNAATLCFLVKRQNQRPKAMPGWNDHVRTSF